MPRLAKLALIALIACSVPAPALGQQPAETVPAPQPALEARGQQVVALLNGQIEPEAIFTRGFRAAIADAQIKALSASLTAQFGPAVAIVLAEPRGGTRAALEIRFERGIGKGGIAIDPGEEGRISELRFTSFDSLRPEGDTPAAIAADLAALPGSVNAWFGPLGGGDPVIVISTDTPLALGSTVKLYVLAALAEDVKAGRRQWADVIVLDQKSYPSGLLHDWPQSAPITLHTLATMMISISDNTATDQLIAVLGKERILRLMRDSGHANPFKNEPFLTTRESFATKASDGLIDLLRKGRSGDDGALDAYFTLLNASWSTPSLDDINAAFAKGPKALDVEWFASPADLAKLLAHMRAVADPKVFEIMAINPSATPAIAANWAYIGYKGGSEPGVLNLTWLLTDKAGRDWMLTLGWNNPAAVLDDGKLEGIAQRILLLPR